MMETLNYDIIHSVVKHFYAKATKDFLIGYHFRSIHDFNTHIPEIAIFWELQLLGSTKREHRPFNLIKTHKLLGVKKGEVGRWVFLFEETLDESNLSVELKTMWMERIRHFADKILRLSLIKLT